MPSAVEPAALPEQGAGSRSADRSADSHAAKRVASSLSSERAALWCFCVYVGIALPLILFHLGRYHWFFGDEWSFLAERNGGNIGDLFRSHGEHWVTIPVVIYRVLFNAFGLRSYVPYQSVVVVAHLTTAVLLRVVMRRAGVSPWTATIVAAVFVLFGPGEENIVWAFQFTFVGALMFGLVHLILSDHDGPIDRRDQLGLLAGVASLMCSGVSLVLVAVVGLAVVVRRGWRPAVFHTAPLGVLYAIWFLTTDPGGIDNPYGRSATTRELLRFVWSGMRGDFRAIGASRPFGFLIAGVLVLGVALSLRRFGGTGLRQRFAPVALLAGGALFLIGTGYTRWFVTPVADNQSRYLYTLAAFTLPAVAVGVDELARRWRPAAPLLLVLFLVPIVANVDDFGSRSPFNAAYHNRQKELVPTLAYSKLAQRVPAYVRPNPWFSIGWLRDAAAAGEVPRPPSASPEIERQLPLLLGLTQLPGRGARTNCGTFSDGVTLVPAKGERLTFDFAKKPPVGANFFVQNLLVVNQLSPAGRSVSSVGYKSDFGNVIEVEIDGLRLHLRAAVQGQDLVLCRSRARSRPTP